jgi:misacylated tRNA(Ala) deacylase
MTEEIFRADAYEKRCEARVTAVDDAGIRLDRTVFYPMGGGQPGDTGVLHLQDGREIPITDTRKDGASGDIVHVPDGEVGADLEGQQVQACIDWERRHRLMRMHTLMHLLCAVIPAGVTGGSVRDGSGRLDFDLPESTLDKEQITAELNRLVEENHPVSARWITDEELATNPDLVRTMSVTPPMGTGKVRVLEVQGVDLQPCGGTHVAATGEIGRVRVRKIEKKGKHNRRVNLELAE